MAIILPVDPAPTSAEPEMVDFGAFLTPSLGGPVQRVNRLGDRFKLPVTCPPLTPDQARVFVSRLSQAKSSSLVMPFPQPGAKVGAEGLPG